MANVGFIGLGVMGGRMVKRLLDAGHTVTGYNRTESRAKWLIDAGMRWAPTPRAAVESSPVTLSMLANTDALQAVAAGPNGILAGLDQGKTYVDMSTVSPSASRALAEKVQARGARMLDAPVSGSVSTLEEGQLSIMVGGDASSFVQVKPILEDIGPYVTHVGANGLAVTMKVAINLSLVVQMLAFSEGVLLAEKSGVKRDMAVDAMLHSVMASPMIKYRGPFIMDPPVDAWFDVDMMQKDVNLALDLGREVDVPLPTTSVASDYLTAARGMGMKEKDFACVFNILARMSGLEA